MNALTPLQADVLARYYGLHGHDPHTQDEIAVALGRSRTAVQHALARARSALARTPREEVKKWSAWAPGGRRPHDPLATPALPCQCVRCVRDRWGPDVRHRKRVRDLRDDVFRIRVARAEDHRDRFRVYDSATPA